MDANSAARAGDRNVLRKLMRNHKYSLKFIRVQEEYRPTPLHEAARAGHVGCVREILSRVVCATASTSFFTAYVNRSSAGRCTALFLAAENGHHDIVKLLVNAGGDMDIKDVKGRSPLHAATSENHMKTIEVLIKKGANVNATDADRRSCLHVAAAKGFSQLVSSLAPLSVLELRDIKQKTALYLAAENGHEKCLKILGDAGAYVDHRVRDGSTPLFAATKTQSEACVELLVENGADPNIVCWDAIARPQKAIHAAAGLQNITILKRLIGVTQRDVDTQIVPSPVYEAVSQPVMLKLLLNAGFSPDGQDLNQVYGVDSPLALLLSNYLNVDDHDFEESMALLIRAGAHLTTDCWHEILEESSVLAMLPKHRQEATEGRQGGRIFHAAEVEALQSVVPEHVENADSWIDTLLENGLDPAALLLPIFFERAESSIVNYLLEFVNWSTLPPLLGDILEQRVKQKTWTPPSHRECVPSLFHLCRLRLRSILGSEVLMRTEAVKHLPVPTLLHSYLQFDEVKLPGSES